MKKLFVAAFLSLSASSAFADLPPQPPLDTCTVENQKKEGEECRLCTGEKPDNSCQQEAQKMGLEKRCVSSAAGGSEIWCGAVTSKTPASVAPPQKRGACSVDPIEGGQSAWLLIGLFGAALYLRRGRYEGR